MGDVLGDLRELASQFDYEGWTSKVIVVDKAIGRIEALELEVAAYKRRVLELCAEKAALEAEAALRAEEDRELLEGYHHAMDREERHDLRRADEERKAAGEPPA